MNMWIVDNLAAPILIGDDYLRQCRATICYVNDTVTVDNPSGERAAIPFQYGLRHSWRKDFILYAAHTMVIPARSAAYINTFAGTAPHGTMPINTRIITGIASTLTSEVGAPFLAKNTLAHYDHGWGPVKFSTPRTPP